MMNPFDSNYFIGYINHVSPQYVKVHFPSSTLLNRYIFSGEEFNGGLVGNFVTIEGENYGFIGKIAELDLPEKERLSLSEKAFQSSDFHPTARVQVLLSFDYYNSRIALRSLNAFPNIGAKVYVCPSDFIQQYVMQFGQKENQNDLLIRIGSLTSNKETQVTLSQQALFGRHCAVVGTTGGGKSWTVSKLVEGIMSNHTKAILIDPTGEYQDLAHSPHGKSVCFGIDTHFSYKMLTVEDLFYLVKPASRIQAPKLLEAIRSLKCIELGIAVDPQLGRFCTNGVLKKAGMDRLAFERFCYKHTQELENGLLDFNLANLSSQITAECVFDSDRNNSALFGQRNDTDVANCVSLITRIDSIRRTGILSSIFGFDATPLGDNLIVVIQAFLKPTQKDQFLLRIGFESVGFESQAREIAANAIGKYLLGKARDSQFKTHPVVLILDEAHQFLNKNVVDEYFASASLSAFDQIAKECRKYGLFLCIATQMPKDIPLGTLSQMGTFIVHRLINYNDKEAIKQACSSADADMLAFLPVLGAGEAIISGVDFPMPLSVIVEPPRIPPNSQTPTFKDILTYKVASGTVLNPSP